VLGLDFLLGQTISFGQLFTGLSISNTPGLISLISVVVTAAFFPWALVVVVERARKCLDFTVTLFIFHLAFAVALDKFPTYWLWWLVHVVCLIYITLVGENLCMRKEMQEIPLTSFGRKMDV